MITWENYEEYIMMYADGELTPAEVNALMAFVNEHPELKKELAAYELTRMAPDTAQVFTGKDALLKPVPAQRTIAFPVWSKYSIAAGVAAIIIISLFMFQPAGKNDQVAVIDTVSHRDIKMTDAPAVATMASPVQHDSAAITTSAPVTSSVAHKTEEVAAVKERTQKQPQVQNVVAQHSPVAKDAIEIKELSMAVMQTLPSSTDQAMPEIKEVPGYTVAIAEEEKKRSFIDMLPIEDLKKQQLENIAGSVAGAYHDVNKAKQDLYNKSITIKVEKKKLIISF